MPSSSTSAQRAATTVAYDAWRQVELILVALGSRFEDVLLTKEGVFQPRCPLDRRHRCFVRLDGGGRLDVQCPDCARADRTAAFVATLRERFPEWWHDEPAPPPELLPVTAWTIQPAGAPAQAIRLMCDGSYELMVEPGREAEAEAWLREAIR